MTLPDPPPPISQSVESPFGDRAAAADERLAGAVDRLLRPRYGRPQERHLAAPATLDIARLHAWYSDHARGWRSLPQVAGAAKAAGGDGFGFERDGRAFVLLVAGAGGGTLRPITIQRYGG